MEAPDCYVGGALATVLRVSRLVGLAPLRFVKRENGWIVTVSPALSVLGHLVVTLFSAALISALFNIGIIMESMEHVGTTNIIRALAFHVRIFVVTVLAAMMVYCAPGYMRRLISCLNQAQKVNFALGIYHWPSPWSRKLVLFFIVWATVSVITSSVYVTLSIYFVLEVTKVSKALVIEIVMLFMLYAFYNVIQVRLAQYVLIVTHVRTSFIAANDCLRNLLRDVKHMKMIQGTNDLPIVNKAYKKINNYVNLVKYKPISDTKEPHQATVRRISHAYSAICLVMKDVDRSQGLMVLLFLSFLFMFLIVTAYDFFDTMTSDHVTLKYMGLRPVYGLMQLLWCAFHIFNLMMLIEPCHLTHLEMQKTRVLMSRLMRSTDSVYEPLAMELEQFYRQLINNNVSYKAFNSTSISRSLLLNILSGITTYLVIMFNIK